MSTLRVYNIENPTTAAGGIGIATDGSVTVGGLQYPTSGPLSNRNLIINGDMRVAQRGTTAFTIGSDDFPTDRFIFGNAGTTSGGGTGIQTATSPAGFSNAVRVDVTTADTSLDASAQYKNEYRVEGLDSAHLNWGTADAQTVTLSFYVRSNKTGNTSVALVNSANDRSYVKTFTIDSADTWERKELSIPGDTSGTWKTDNTTGIRIRWGSFGSTFQTSSVNQWTAGQFMSRDDSPINFFDTIANTFYLTGVQLEVGERATPFEHRSYGDEFAKCQRYYQRVVVCGGNDGAGVMRGSSISGASEFGVNGSVVMRGRPAISNLTSNDTLEARSVNSGHSEVDVTFASLTANNDEAQVESMFSHIRIRCTPGLSDGEPYVVFSNGQGGVVLAADAEL